MGKQVRRIFKKQRNPKNVLCLLFELLDILYAGGQKLPGNYRGEQIMR